jgi:PTS system galactitol-specific IIA component
MQSIKISTLFHPQLIIFDIEARDSLDLLRQLSSKLLEKGYVKESFEEAIIEREKRFPTGLPTQGIMVALPHTDPQYVIKPGILIANLKKPVIFKEMGNGVKDIPAELIFMLAVDKPEKQIEVLKKLMNIFTKKEVLLSIKNAKNEAAMLDILESQMS